MKRLLLTLLLASLAAACTPMEEQREALMVQARDYARAGNCTAAVDNATQAVALDPLYPEARLIIGRCAMREGKSSEAQDQFSRVLELVPDSLESLQNLARLALVRGETAKASEYAEKAFALGGASTELLILRAGILMNEGKYSEAKPLFDQALEAEPDNEEVVVGLASALINTDEKEKARELLEASLEKFTASREVAALLFAMTVEEGDLEKSAALLSRMQERGMADEDMVMRLADMALGAEAIDTYITILRKRLETNPDSLEARIRLADIEAEQGRFTQALELLEASKVHTETVTLARASVLARAGRMDEAMVVLNTLIADGKDTEVVAKARMGLAEVFMQRNLPAEAEKELSLILADFPDNDLARFMRSQVSFSQHKYAEAVKDLMVIVNADPDNYAAQLSLADAQNASGNAGLAESTLTALIARNPNVAQAYIALANLYLISQSPDAALMALAIGHSALPDDLSIAIAEADILAGLKRFDKAVELLEGLIKKGDNADAVRLRLAAVYGVAGEHDKAASVFKRILENNPDAAVAAEGRVKALIAAKKEKEALAFAEERQQSRPDDPLSALLAGEAALAAQNPQKAEAAFRKALDIAPQWEQPLASLVQLYSSSGRHEQAISLCREFIAKTPDSPGPTVMLAMLLDQQGKYAEAEREYRNTLIKDPDNVLAANNLAFLLTRHKPDTMRLREAENLAKRASASDSPASFDTLGWVQHMLGRHADALPNIRRAHEAFKDNPVIGYHLATVLAELSFTSQDKAEAAEMRDEAIVLLQNIEKLKGNFVYRAETALLLARLKKAR